MRRYRHHKLQISALVCLSISGSRAKWNQQKMVLGILILNHHSENYYAEGECCTIKKYVLLHNWRSGLKKEFSYFSLITDLVNSWINFWKGHLEISASASRHEHRHRHRHSNINLVFCTIQITFWVCLYIFYQQFNNLQCVQ